MGEVYLGYHRYLKKRVAVKVLRHDVDGLPDILARFEREAIAGAHVSHPNVAAATDFGKLSDGSFFLVVEHVRGQTLADLIRGGGRFAPARAARIARQIAGALDAVHALGIVHRDVKSRNVMIGDGPDEVAKLIDFGLARVPLDRFSGAAGAGNPRRSRLDSAPQRITGVGEVFGTVAYLAPESAFGMDMVDGRTDLYALGVLFFEMLAGRRPFTATDAYELFAEQRSGPPRIAARSPGAVVPEPIEAVVRRLLASDPDDRFQTGAEVVAAIDEALACSQRMASSTTVSALRPVASEPPWQPPPRREVRLVATVLIALATAATGAMFLVRAVPRRVPAPVITAHVATPPVAQAPAPTATATATGRAITPGSPTDAAAAARQVVRAARARDMRGAARALTAVAEQSPAGLRDPEVAAAARDVAVAVAADPAGDGVLEVLAQSGPGLDVLYAIVERRGGTRAAARAAEMLRRPDVAAAASPALRIAFAVRDAPCADKLVLLDRATREGDARALVALETQGRACFPRNREVETAILTLRARLSRR